MSDIELKPCPFCSGKVKVAKYEYGDGYVIDHPNSFDPDSYTCPISCYEGEGIGCVYYDTEQEAAEAWNKRVE